jgi:hypothetical protein
LPTRALAASGRAAPYRGAECAAAAAMDYLDASIGSRRLRLRRSRCLDCRGLGRHFRGIPSGSRGPRLCRTSLRSRCPRPALPRWRLRRRALRVVSLVAPATLYSPLALELAEQSVDTLEADA